METGPESSKASHEEPSNRIFANWIVTAETQVEDPHDKKAFLYKSNKFFSILNQSFIITTNLPSNTRPSQKLIIQEK